MAFQEFSKNYLNISMELLFCPIVSCFSCYLLFKFDKILWLLSLGKSIALPLSFKAEIMVIFWDYLMFHQIFLSPQVRQNAIISDKHGIYKLSHELSNDLRLMILGN